MSGTAVAAGSVGGDTRERRAGRLGFVERSASRVTIDDATSPRGRHEAPAHFRQRRVHHFGPTIGPGNASPRARPTATETRCMRGIVRYQEGTPMKIVKDICTVVPAVLVTATAVIGVATVIGLSSWALL